MRISDWSSDVCSSDLGEEDLRDAFRSGWHERNRNPGLKRQARKNVHNAIMNSIGGGRHLEKEYVLDQRTYHNSLWTNSGFRKDLCKGPDSADKIAIDTKSVVKGKSVTVRLDLGVSRIINQKKQITK